MQRSHTMLQKVIQFQFNVRASLRGQHLHRGTQERPRGLVTGWRGIDC